MRKPNAVRVQRWRDKQRALLAMEAMLVTEQGGGCEESLAPPPPPSPTPPTPPTAPTAPSKKCRSKVGSANINKNSAQCASAGIGAPIPMPAADGSATQVKKTRKVKPLVIHTKSNDGVSKKNTSTKLKKCTAKANVPVEGLVASPSGGGGGVGGGSGRGVAEAYRTRKRMKRPVNPVKIEEHPDMFQIDKGTHAYARVRFSRGQPVVDIRRYIPDVKRMQFYYTAKGGSMVMSHSEFASLVKNGPKISELLEQYGGGGGLDGGGGGVHVEGCDAAATSADSADTDATLWL
jgi:hypothetical protein